MSVKLRGADYKAFLNDSKVWKEGYWFDASELLVDGEDVGDDYDESDLPDEARVTVSNGCFYAGPEVNSTFYDYETVLRKWLKARTVTTVVLEVANDKLEEYRSVFANLPGVKTLR